MAYIELNHIQKSFTDGGGGVRKVLDGLDLKVEQGDFVSVTGVSGTGKTTLLNIIGTLLQPDGGSYQFDGETIPYERLRVGASAGMDNRQLLQLRNQQIGFMFQDHRLLPQLTAWQNMLLPALAIRKKPSEADVTWAEELAQKMGIGGVLQQLPETLSGGEKSRVALCRALIMKPKLLLADEPTGQLDSEHADEVARLLKTVNEQLGMTLIVVTHSERLAAAANHVYELKDGICKP